jgi:hypothetical protein
MAGTQESSGQPSRTSTPKIVALWVALVLGMSVSMTACGVSINRDGRASITGSGKIVSKEIPVSSFSGLEVANTFDVTVSLGEQEKLTLRVDDNLVDHVDVGVSGGTLRIGLKPGTSVRRATLQASVTTKGLSDIGLSGASNVRVSGELTGRALELTASGASRFDGTARVDEATVGLTGASRMKLAGSAGRLTVEGNGASDLDAPQLQVRDLDITLSGASKTTVSVSDTVAAELSGASSLRYRGSPRFTRQQTSGGSSVTTF